MKKSNIIIGAIALVAAALIAGLIIWNSREPEQPTVLPNGTSIEELGGWSRLNTPTGHPIMAYTDSIDDVSIRVSQQQMKGSPEVSEMAKEFNATQEVNSDGGVKIHLGTSVEGPQFAIFTKNDLLILIKSQNKIEDGSWAKYVDSLEPSSNP